jgi:hypothetical protein
MILPIALSGGVILLTALAFGASAKNEYNALKSLKFSFVKLGVLGIELKREPKEARLLVDIVAKNSFNSNLSVNSYHLKVIAPDKTVLGISQSNKPIILKKGNNRVPIPINIQLNPILKKVKNLFTAKEFVVFIKGEVDYGSPTLGTELTIPINEKVNIIKILGLPSFT